MYCTCSDKKKVDLTIEHKPVEVCSKRLGGCGKEIYKYSKQTSYGKLNLSEYLIGERFRTRSGKIVKLIKVNSEANNYPFVFQEDNMGILTTDKNGSFSINEHNSDIVEML